MDRYYFPTGACRLEGKDGKERRPARVTNGLSKVMVPDHTCRLQLLMINNVVCPHQRKGRLVVKVLPLASRRLMCFRHKHNRLAAAVAAFLASRYPSLGGFQRSFRLAIPARMKNTCAIGERCGCL
jgi:hypothetical protein